MPIKKSIPKKSVAKKAKTVKKKLEKTTMTTSVLSKKSGRPKRLTREELKKRQAAKGATRKKGKSSIPALPEKTLLANAGKREAPPTEVDESKTSRKK